MSYNNKESRASYNDEEEDVEADNYDDSAATINNNLQDSEFTATDSTSSLDNPKEPTTWFHGISSDFRNIAHCLTDNVPPVMSGVTNFVHRTAIAVANEISQLEEHNHGNDVEDEILAEETEENKLSIVNDSLCLNKARSTSTSTTTSSTGCSNKDDDNTSLLLPWEIRQEFSTKMSSPSSLKKATCANNNDDDDESIPVYITDNILMEHILDLSKYETTFLEPFTSSEEVNTGKNEINDIVSKYKRQNKQEFILFLTRFSSDFMMDESRITLIRRLMDIDKNLAMIHSKFSGKSRVDETLFWKNYFFHCERARTNRLAKRRSKKERQIQQQKSTSASAISSEKSVATADPAMIDTIIENVDMKRKLDRVFSSIGDDGDDNNDGESLIPAESISGDEREAEDDSSYVIASAPNSLNTFTTTRSIDDSVVLVDNTDETTGKY